MPARGVKTRKPRSQPHRAGHDITGAQAERNTDGEQEQCFEQDEEGNKAPTGTT